ncbi:MAG: hypothetical protein V1644_00275 [Candidatus Micrarchaeota archaeon]
MPKPKIVDIKKPQEVKKPKVVSQTETAGLRQVTSEEDFSRLITDTSRDELRKQQLKDIVPNQPKPGEPLQAVSEDMWKKIEEDRKKRRGLGGEVKDLLRMK